MTDEMKRFIRYMSDEIGAAVSYGVMQPIVDKDPAIAECAKAGGDHIDYGQPLSLDDKRKMHAAIWATYKACQYLSVIMECARTDAESGEIEEGTVYELLGLLLGNADFREACRDYPDDLPPEAEDFTVAGLAAVEDVW